MKLYLPAFLFIFYSIIASAQPITSDEANQLLRVPVLAGETTASTIQPNLETLCFDKKMMVVSTTEDGSELFTCLFINTRMGFIGFYSQKSGAAGSCNINPDADRFRFTVISLRGNTYQYKTDLKNGRLEKKVITSNSDFYYYPWTGLNPDAAILQKLDETGSYGHRRSRISTRAYQASGSTAKFHLFGNDLPASIRVTSSSRYLGVFGVGYVTFENRVYLQMALLNNSTTVAYISLAQNEENCFNTAGFAIFEDEYYNKAKAKIRLDREKLLNQNITSGPCSSNDLPIKNLKMQMLDKEEAWLEKTRQGNLLLDNPAQQALAKMYNYEDQLQLGIYEQEKKICKYEDMLSRKSTVTANERQKLDCYRRQLSQMRANQGEMAAIESRYPGNLGKQVSEKQKLMMRMELCN
ncbi:MAG: hypothetical protein FJY20_10060 [Bacteroidetes bacterium]|nr:hypothetical protein [Bacteroidota bacterium]